jgi:anthranilate synthase component II
MILVIDNYDSFTFNLVQYLAELGANVVVKRNDELSVEDVERFGARAIVISPGPGTPEQAGISIAVIRRMTGTIPILGVCLGHQAIAVAYGGKVSRGVRVMHGKTSRIRHRGEGLFAGLPDPLEVMRYHSLTVAADELPAELVVDAVDEDGTGEIHALRHREHHVYGVQFHPESILSQGGHELLANFMARA